MKRQNSKQIKAIAFILIEFTLPILLGLIHPALEVGSNVSFIVWQIGQVVVEKKEQE